jgi:hypothetical protein
MSWITNLFKKSPKRLPARDHIGRFLADDNGNVLYTDAPVELIEKAKAKALKRDKELVKQFNAIHDVPKTKPPVAKKPAPKTAAKPVAKKPVAKKTTSTTAKKATPKKK